MLVDSIPCICVCVRSSAVSVAFVSLSLFVYFFFALKSARPLLQICDCLSEILGGGGRRGKRAEKRCAYIVLCPLTKIYMFGFFSFFFSLLETQCGLSVKYIYIFIYITDACVLTSVNVAPIRTALIFRRVTRWDPCLSAFIIFWYTSRSGEVLDIFSKIKKVPHAPFGSERGGYSLLFCSLTWSPQLRTNVDN